jgi:hypothetical protein
MEQFHAADDVMLGVRRAGDGEVDDAELVAERGVGPERRGEGNDGECYGDEEKRTGCIHKEETAMRRRLRGFAS